jgi:glutamyl-tRNA reductase
VDQVLQAEMERVRVQLGHSAAADEIHLALRRTVRRLLHEPAVRARELAAAGRQDDYLAALDLVFGIAPPGGALSAGISAGREVRPLGHQPEALRHQAEALAYQPEDRDAS